LGRNISNYITLLELIWPAIVPKVEAHIADALEREGSKYGIDDYLVTKYLCIGGLA
jgi:hypothetical protein